MLKIVETSWVESTASTAIEIGFLTKNLGSMDFLLTNMSIIQAVKIVSVPDSNKINLGNSKSSELMVVKVKGIKMARA